MSKQIATTHIPNSSPQDWKPGHCIHLSQVSSFYGYSQVSREYLPPECGKDATRLDHTLVWG